MAIAVLLAGTVSCAGPAVRRAAGPPPGLAVPGNTTPEGFKRVGGAANGVMVSVPDDWTVLDLANDDLERGLAGAGLSGTALGEARKSLRALAANSAVWASDRESARQSAKRFATNLNGFCRPERAVPAGRLIEAARKRLRGLGAAVTEAGEMPLGPGTAVRIVYMFPTGGLRVHGTQFYVPGDGRMCIVTLSTDQQDRQPLFDRIGRTIRLI
ncbi:hypothetical protein [Spongiactinospora sp. TRM90649]|uniref:hypothetical protein n=1 Tax=Spongiactinospora sp. TRM90649 TaxID=3031114 RepID=UPI0023F75A2C|nr:hypothetical protein [Spongiactinospora sp. TRM90649]MDF5752218.1 hypothetical protein [Spongiactinospora sp. TRM90649]